MLLWNRVKEPFAMAWFGWLQTPGWEIPGDFKVDPKREGKDCIVKGKECSELTPLHVEVLCIFFFTKYSGGFYFLTLLLKVAPPQQNYLSNKDEEVGRALLA